MARPQVSLVTVFADLPDPRMDRTKLHALSDIILMAVCAVTGGADSWEEIAEFGRCKAGWLRRFLKRANGTPLPDTFARVFALLDPSEFQKRFARWLVELGEPSGLRPIAVDGKAVRGAKRATASGCLHVVSAWATRQRLILGQTTVADGSNETAALPELLRLLDLKGALSRWTRPAASRRSPRKSGSRAAIPFFHNTLLGDAVYSTALFGGLALAEYRFPLLRERPALTST